VSASLPVADRLAPPTPADPKEIMRRGQSVARALRGFVKSHPEQVWQIDGNSHPRAEAWQFVAACYGHTAMVTSTQETEGGFLAIAHLRNSAGEIVSGAEAICERAEEAWRDREMFQLRSMAQTRACAKVTRNVFAWVMVLAGFSPTPAEEMEFSAGGRGASPMTGKKCHECGNQLSNARWNDTRRRYGKALCFDHEAIEKQSQADQIVKPITDPKFVAESVKRVQGKKASQGQPIVDLLDAIDDKDAYSL